MILFGERVRFITYDFIFYGKYPFILCVSIPEPTLIILT